ncbi:MAG: hypothetical protein KAV87_50595 [Desulfobacteraceae bacterium]|nr:hypothetical protein [Desulfobacteraceae bacterium]
MQIEFNSKERKLLLDALLNVAYVDKIQGAPDQISIIYDNLIKKLTTKEVEATEGRPVHAIEVLRKEINFINFKFPEMNVKEKAAAADVIIDLDRARAYLEDL